MDPKQMPLSNLGVPIDVSVSASLGTTNPGDNDNEDGYRSSSSTITTAASFVHPSQASASWTRLASMDQEDPHDGANLGHQQPHHNRSRQPQQRADGGPHEASLLLPPQRPPGEADGSPFCAGSREPKRRFQGATKGGAMDGEMDHPSRKIVALVLFFAVAALGSLAYAGVHALLSYRNRFASSTWENNDGNHYHRHNGYSHGSEQGRNNDFTSSFSSSKYQKVRYFGFQIYTGGAPAFLNQHEHPNRNTSSTTGEGTEPTRVPNPECIITSTSVGSEFSAPNTNKYGQVPLDDGINLQCYVGNKDPMVDVAERLRIMKDAIEAAYDEYQKLLADDSLPSQEPSNEADVLKIFAAPEFFFRGASGAYDFTDDPKRLDKIFGFNHTDPKSHENGSTDDGDDDEVCSGDSPVCAVLLGLQEMVQDERFEDWLFLFGTVVATQRLEVAGGDGEGEDANGNDGTGNHTHHHHHPTHDDNYEYLYYNFAPVYKGFDPAWATFHNKNGSNDGHHFALGKRFLVPKRYVSTSDFLTPKRDVDWIDRGSEWEELFGDAVDEEESSSPTDEIPSGEWVTAFGRKDETESTASEESKATTVEATKPAIVVDNPRSYQHKRYDDDWFEAYKVQLYESAGYVQVEYDWLVVDGIAFTVEICLDHQLRRALDTFQGDLVTGRTTRIPSTNQHSNGLGYAPIPTHQAQIGLVASAGMSPNAESLALTQNGILFLQDGLSNHTARAFVDTEQSQQCGPQQGLQYEGGTVAVRRRALVSKTDVRFEYELLSGNGGPCGGASKSSAGSGNGASEELACEHKIPVYGAVGQERHPGDSHPERDWKGNLRGIFSTEMYEPHLVVYGPFDIPNTGR
ncbi:unnamed protein product [Pseudo-nitzschia multistriata]|uniref:Uncharacterized protein n=1 Tax=Pseudo-nitzschia multistriata TaxID=183589 RepID=A0A448YWZ7_9STRA|nr:unnamed protein product [Pseudo-nitzschia multistriata]